MSVWGWVKSSVFGAKPPATPAVGVNAPVSAPAPKPRIEAAEVVPSAGIGAGLDKAAPPPPVAPAVAPAPADDLAEKQKAKDPQVTEIFVTPTKRTSTTLTFRVPSPEGKEMKPGERWLFQVPPDLRGANIRTMVLVHRKDPKNQGPMVGSREEQGAYSLVTARKTGTEQWVTWSDQYGSKKYAEPRSAYDPENENLHDWMSAVGATPIDLVAVTSVGSGEKAITSVHELVVEFFPPGQVGSKQEEIFTPGTEFADPAVGRIKPKYGGGMGAHFSDQQLKEHGLYPQAIELGGYGGNRRDVSQNAYLDSQGNLHIKLPPGKVLGGFEIAVGDTAFEPSRPASEQRNKDGHVGRLGWAKLYAWLSHNGQRGEQFMEKVNVPPSGVLSGGPAQTGYVTQPGDEIVVQSQGHLSWVMGYSVKFMEPGT